MKTAYQVRAAKPRDPRALSFRGDQAKLADGHVITKEYYHPGIHGSGGRNDYTCTCGWTGMDFGRSIQSADHHAGMVHNHKGRRDSIEELAPDFASTLPPRAEPRT